MNGAGKWSAVTRCTVPHTKEEASEPDMSAGGVAVARPEDRRAGGGSTPTSALQNLRVMPVPFRIAKALLVREHYLHSMPGGTTLAFGVVIGERLLGALTLGVGPPSGVPACDRSLPRRLPGADQALA